MARRKAKEKSTLNPGEQMDLFIKRKEELWASRAVQLGLNFSVTFEWKADNNELTINTKEPDIEDFRSFLTIFRKFIANDSPIFLPRIYSLCHQYISDQKCREILADARATWQRLHASNVEGLSITIDGEIMSKEAIVDLWINGHYFHDDIDKMRLLESLEPDLFATTRALFFEYVTETTKIIQHLAHHIVVAREKGWLTN